MCENLAIFSSIFWLLAFIMLFLILFEKKLIAFEDRWREARKRRIKDLEKTVDIQDKLIVYLFAENKKLGKELSKQHKINSINLEELRQERLKNSREVKR